MIIFPKVDESLLWKRQVTAHSFQALIINFGFGFLVWPKMKDISLGQKEDQIVNDQSNVSKDRHAIPNY